MYLVLSDAVLGQTFKIGGVYGSSRLQIAVDERNDGGGILGCAVELAVGDSSARASRTSSDPTSRRKATTSSRTVLSDCCGLFSRISEYVAVKPAESVVRVRLERSISSHESIATDQQRAREQAADPSERSDHREKRHLRELAENEAAECDAH